VTDQCFYAAVVGAGPAGIYAARELARNGVRVVLFNRDIKPGGLAEYGIYPDKHTMKRGLRQQFHQVLDTPGLTYCGNVTIGAKGDLTLDDLRGLGFQAILVCAGAQGIKWLGIPGEALPGVYHAKGPVFHYNLLPPYTHKIFDFGKRVAIVGAGNVMLDIARYLTRRLKVDEVVALVRRGPAEVKFDRKELEHVVANLDLEAFDREIERVAPQMQAIGQDPQAAKQAILDALPKAEPPNSRSRFRMEFLVSPVRVLGEEVATGLEVEENYLSINKNGVVSARGTGKTRAIEVDSVVFAIGDRVDTDFGLPVSSSEFAKNPAPRFPVDDISYEAYDPDADAIIPDVFVAGWSRQASTGLVGYARKDGVNGAKAVMQYLKTLQPITPDESALAARLKAIGKPVVNLSDIRKLAEIEDQIARQRGLETFKFGSNEEMLEKIMSIG
jgi:ferredoxin--NADP+ reductase